MSAEEEFRDEIGLREFHGLVTRRGRDFYYIKPGTVDEVVCVPDYQWTPEMKNEMAEWLRRFE